MGREMEQGAGADSADLRRFYDQWAAKRAQSADDQEYVRLADEWKWENLLPLVTRFIPHPRHILELGCGSGDMLVLARQSFPEAALYGLDWSAQMLDMARVRLPGATFIEGDASALDSLPIHADLALAVDILEHLPDPLPTIRLLGTSARFVAFKIPLERRVLKFGIPRPPARGPAHPAGHLHFWTLDESRALLAASGLELLAETWSDPPESIRYHPGTLAPIGAQSRDNLTQRLRQMHHSWDVAFEKWSCKHAPVIHRLFYGSNHFAICRLR